MAKSTPKQDKILKDYENKAQEIIDEMLLVLMRAYRKVDDASYRQLLEKLNIH